VCASASEVANATVPVEDATVHPALGAAAAAATVEVEMTHLGAGPR